MGLGRRSESGDGLGEACRNKAERLFAAVVIESHIRHAEKLMEVEKDDGTCPYVGEALS